MNQTATKLGSAKALTAKKALASKFFKKGIALGLFSGVSYGIYTALLTMGMNQGIWKEWTGPASVLSSFVIIYLLSALGSAINDTCSAMVSIILCYKRTWWGPS